VLSVAYRFHKLPDDQAGDHGGLDLGIQLEQGDAKQARGGRLTVERVPGRPLPPVDPIPPAADRGRPDALCPERPERHLHPGKAEDGKPVPDGPDRPRNRQGLAADRAITLEWRHRFSVPSRMASVADAPARVCDGRKL